MTEWEDALCTLERSGHGRACMHAAMCGDVARLRYAHERGFCWDEWTCAFAARGGHLECLRYARDHGCPWNGWTTADAAGSGSLACLVYAHVNGCEWNGWACMHAAMSGKLECLRYAHEHGEMWDAWVFVYAANCGHDACLRYAYEQGCPYPPALRRTVVQKVLLPKWREYVRLRRVAMYWWGKATESACAPGGAGRARDLEAFVREWKG